MPSYNSMTPFLKTEEEEHKISERPILQVVSPQGTPQGTPQATATSSKHPDFDWKQWDGPGWHNQPWPESDIKRSRDGKAASSQLQNQMATSEDLSQLSHCQRCGLTSKHHEIIKACICGHHCRDLPHETVCPDINALHLGGKDCPTPRNGPSGLTRRRSSLSKSPMVAHDQSTYEDADIEKSTDAAKSSVGKHAGGGAEEAGKTKSSKHDHTQPLGEPVYHTCCNANGDADWRKHCRVEKAMTQMLFGDARVSTPTVLEHTQRLRTSEQNLAHHGESVGISENVVKDFKGDELRSAMTEARTAAKKRTNVCVEQGKTVKGEVSKRDGSNGAEMESVGQSLDCAVYPDGEENPEMGCLKALPVAKPLAKTHGCNF